MIIRKIGGRGSAAQTYTTTVITSSTTFVASGAGVYRIMCLGSGGTGSGTSGQRGAGSAIPVYAEVTLTAAQNVTVTIAAGRAGINEQKVGTPGNATSFGTLVVGPGGSPGFENDGGTGLGRRRRCRRSGRHARQCRRRARGRWRRVGTARLSSGPVRRCDLGERDSGRGAIIGLWWGRGRRVACQRVWPKRIQRRRQQGGPGQRLWRRQRRSW
jgi:hypothetical protein